MLPFPTFRSLATSCALTLGALALVSSAAEAQKGKPAPSNFGVTLDFADGQGDLVASDGLGPYSNGQDGVSATVNLSSGDLVVTFSTSRDMAVTLGTPIDGSGPVPGTYEARRLYVNDINSLSVGQTQMRIARVLEFPALANHVVGFLDTQQTGVVVGGTPVCVTRDSDVGWTIATASVTCTPGGIGALFTQTSRRGSTLITPLARYALPFSVTVTKQ